MALSAVARPALPRCHAALRAVLAVGRPAAARHVCRRPPRQRRLLRPQRLPSKRNPAFSRRAPLDRRPPRHRSLHPLQKWTVRAPAPAVGNSARHVKCAPGGCRAHTERENEMRSRFGANTPECGHRFFPVCFMYELLIWIARKIFRKTFLYEPLFRGRTDSCACVCGFPIGFFDYIGTLKPHY